MWSHKKYKGEFKLSRIKAKDDLVFQFIIGGRKKTYESWQAAKKDGWVKND